MLEERRSKNGEYRMGKAGFKNTNRELSTMDFSAHAGTIAYGYDLANSNKAPEFTNDQRSVFAPSAPRVM